MRTCASCRQRLTGVSSRWWGRSAFMSEASVLTVVPARRKLSVRLRSIAGTSTSVPTDAARSITTSLLWEDGRPRRSTAFSSNSIQFSLRNGKVSAIVLSSRDKGEPVATLTYGKANTLTVAFWPTITSHRQGILSNSTICVVARNASLTTWTTASAGTGFPSRSWQRIPSFFCLQHWYKCIPLLTSAPLSALLFSMQEKKNS